MHLQYNNNNAPQIEISSAKEFVNNSYACISQPQIQIEKLDKLTQSL